MQLDVLYNNLFNFLNQYKVSNTPSVLPPPSFTHVSIGPPYAKYNIPEEKLDQFYDLYSDCVNQELQNLHIAEKQLDADQPEPLIIDIDIDQLIPERQLGGHGSPHTDLLDSINSICHTILKKYYDIEELGEDILHNHILEKDNPTKVTSLGGSIKYKDGIHIVYHNIGMVRTVRKKILEEIANAVDESDIFDEYNFTYSKVDTAIINVPWLLYGSRKKDGGIYKHWYYGNLNAVGEPGCMYSPGMYEFFEDNKHIIQQLSCRRFIDSQPTPLISDTLKYVPKTMLTKKKDGVVNLHMVRKLVNILSQQRSTSYDTWLNVCFALKNTDEQLFSSFVNFSKRCPEKYNYIVCKQMWDNAKPADDGFTVASIKFWAKQDNPGAFFKIMKEFDKSDKPYEKMDQKEESGELDYSIMEIVI
jgi:hypothetical protein